MLPANPEPSRRTKKLLFIILFFLIFSTLFLSHPSSVRAVLNHNYMDTLDAISECENSGGTYVQCFTHNVMESGVDIVCTSVGACEDPNNINSGLIHSLNSVIASLFQPPAQTQHYLAFVKSRLSPPPAYAQGAGYTGLQPIIEVWSIFRNITYFFFVIIFIVVGFLIMFRTKINPQTVISIQNSLPRLILTLVLVTFSYAIAGLLIDLSYFITFLAISVLYANNPAVQTIFSENNVIEIFFTEIFTLGDALSVVSPVNIQTGSVTGSFAQAISQSVSAMLGNLIGVGWATDKIVRIILAVIVIYTLIRLFMILLETFLSIIISVIFAPIFLLFNALPGSNAFTNWLKNLAGNTLVFPGVAVFIMVGGMLVGSKNLGLPNIGVNNPNSSLTLPLLPFSAAKPAGLQPLIGLGFILLAPSVAQMIKEALKIEPFKYTKDIYAAIGAGLWPVRYLWQQRQERQAMLKQEQMMKRALSSKEG